MSQPWKPLPHQKKALKFMLAQPEGGLLLDPGLGKTSIALAMLKVTKLRALVVAPLRVCHEVWPREARKWDEFSGMRVEVLHGDARLQRMPALRREAEVYCINPEGLPWLVRQEWKLPEVLIVDESTKFKNTQTLRFKTLKPLLPRFQRRHILTGTPVPNGLIDLFGQVYILDLGNALGRFITAYRNQFFFQTGYGGYTWQIAKGAEERIYERVRPITLRLAAEDYLEMPERIDVLLESALPKAGADAYAKLEDDYILDRTADDPVTAENAAALSSKLRQLVGGFVYTESGETKLIHTAKLEMLEDLLEELSGQPALIAYQFNHEADEIAARFEIPILKGSTKHVRDLLELWNAGTLPALLLHPASAGHGLNLQEGGHHLIWYSLPWDEEHYDQTFRRLWRQGQEKPVTQHHLVMRDTVDELVLKALARKERVQTQFLDAMKGRARR